MDEIRLKPVRRVAWIGSDGGWKIGDTLDFHHGSRVQVRELKSGDVLFVPVNALQDYPAEPIEEPAVR